MERFAIKISDELRLNLYNICRLCGIDNPMKIKILDSLKISSDSDEEPCLSKKIECVVGIKVKRNDQMPQSICNLCADKINDFFEYREMCGATNIQTRKLLGIPLETKRKKLTNDKEIKVEGESILGLGIEDEDLTDNPLTLKPNLKQTKHRVKGRPKKKGNNSKKKVVFKDEDVKLESEEIKTETQTTRDRHSRSKKLSDLKKKVDPTPLLTLKEPNKRERRREIDAQKLERRRIREEQKREIEEKKKEIELAKQILEQKKLEKKRKSKNSDQEPLVKKPKQEFEVDVSSRHSCTICTESFLTGDILTSHLQQSHTASVSTFGCSSCAESFKSLNEEKDHELWHSLSKTPYICPICNVAFEKNSIFIRHITLCKPFTLTPTVTNIHCKNCFGEFLTQNLYQWHDCFVKANGKCWHCNRIFVKASTLFKHTFKCTSNSGTDTAPTIITSSATIDPRRNRKLKSIDRESHIKSEPEANLDMDVSVTHILNTNMVPRVVLTKTIFKPNQTAVNEEEIPINVKTEHEIDLEDNSQLDEAFRDAEDSDVNDEAEQVNGFPSAIDAPETLSDDDVILIENNEEPVLVNGSPSAARNVVEKPFVLPIIIKREPVDTYEVIAPPMFDPNKKIKTEPMDRNGEEYNERDRHVSPKRLMSKSRRSKKLHHHKANKEKHQPLVRIKEEPIQPDEFNVDILRMPPTHNLGSAIVSLPTTSLLAIKQEPIRPGYDDEFDPVLALNIKKEPGTDDSNSSRLPSLRLIISKKHGTLNAKLISAQNQNTDDAQTSPKLTKSKRVKDKRLYKKPALLAEKIRQEMIARMAKDKENEMTNQQSIDKVNDFTVPVIDRVLDATTISDLPLIQVKIEPKSPCHNVDHTFDFLHDMQTPLNARSQKQTFIADENHQVESELKLFSKVIIDTARGCALLSEAPNQQVQSTNIEVLSTFLSVDESLQEIQSNVETHTVMPTDNSESSALTAYMETNDMKLSSNFKNLTTLSPVKECLQDVDTSNHSESNNVMQTSNSGLTDPPSTAASLLDVQTTDFMGTNDTTAISKAESSSLSNFESVQSQLQHLQKVDHAKTKDVKPSYTKHATSEVKHICDDKLTANYMIAGSRNSTDQITCVITESQQSRVDRTKHAPPVNEKCQFHLKDTYKIPNDEHRATFQSIDEIIETLPLPDEKHIELKNKLLNSNDEKAREENPSTITELLRPKEVVDEKNSLLQSDTSEARNSQCRSQFDVENSNLCNKISENSKLKSNDEFSLMNGNDDIEMELLKSSVNENSDYEMNSVQTLTTSAIHEQLHSLLEDISEDSLSCDLDDKTVDWEWESRLLGD